MNWEKMGGIGSTRWKGHRKAATVEECLPLDTRDFRHRGDFDRKFSSGAISWATTTGEPVLDASYQLTGGESGSAMLSLRYFADAGIVIQKIEAVATTPNFGGKRWWLRCDGCGLRARRLFIPPDGGRFLCRRCHKLTYQSSQQSHTFEGNFRRLLRYADLFRVMAGESG